ncbi:hypothetical protein B1748_31350 [Paenibacillus sp. MY03]|uniref:hypothetical protein n=1 Tax=Paenibacillus sp. MY03 TaxID=302980 RepID=UPI000B3C8F1B|nr:hypothetical protein [Paenibacillus sp. MY03]OUS69479.1 hypothetical protein B1748_31350 [Paenibacillus sp. MY03]
MQTDGTIIIRIANRREGGTVKVAQFGFLVASPDALPEPRRVSAVADGTISRLQWEPVGGADLYNIYRNHQLIAMTDGQTFGSEGGLQRGVYTVSAYVRQQGEGMLIPPIRVVSGE